ncbi:MAG: ComF family protein [Chitinophagaceae bacterium]
MKAIYEISDALQHLFFPHVCKGCLSDNLHARDHLCFHCLLNLPYTGFEDKTDNATEKTFWGRLPIISATSLLYFTPGSIVQKIIHQIKYKGEADLAIFMGRLMGMALQDSNRFSTIEGIVPVPLHPRKFKIRGYNQAQLLSEGISEITGLPVFTSALIRNQSSETQTHKNRMERWENVDGLFSFLPDETGNTKGILLVDDVMTTGATLEACAQAIIREKNTELSIATLAFAAQ